MSKNKGFSETSAGRYSLALYELATEANVLEEIEIHTTSIINLISSSKDFKSLIKDPTNNKEDQLNALNKISEQYKLNNLLTKFLSFLISKRRFFYVDKILKNFVETCSIKRGELKAELTSAKDLTENEINSIKEELTKNFIESAVIGKVLGPVGAPIFRLKRKFRVRLLVRGRKSLKVQNSLAEIIKKFKFPTGMKLTVDVDPINFN